MLASERACFMYSVRDLACGKHVHNSSNELSGYHDDAPWRPRSQYKLHALARCFVQVTSVLDE